MQATLYGLKTPESLNVEWGRLQARRLVAERISEQHQFNDWQSWGWRSFVVTNPCTLVFTVAGGQQAYLQLPREVLRIMKSVSLSQWPDWYHKQFDASVVAPMDNHIYLYADENKHARV